MNTTQTSKKGFTIIEVVLVLAIAALIFLMIFIALPALQRGQRDTSRRNDASTVAAAVNSYKSNNRGAVNTLTTNIVRQYVTELNQYDPATNLTVVQTRPASATAAAVQEGSIVVFRQTRCGNPPAPGQAHPLDNNNLRTARNASVVVRLENAAGDNNWQLYCVDV